MTVQIIQNGNFDHPLAKVLLESYQRAENHNTNLPVHVYDMLGMSGRKYRILINNLINNIKDPRYLEIGVWQGSTFCSAICGNKVTATAIDIWEDASIKNVFLENLKNISSENHNINVLHSDFRKINFENLGKFNVYMFDGPHDYIDQFEGVDTIQNALDDEYILIVDDYNDSQVQTGTQDGLKKTNQKIIASMTILTGQNPYLQKTDWHNGYYIAVIQK